MANPAKYVSVNLNKSYGGSGNHYNNQQYQQNSGRPRPAGGGGGMVVLSRPRSSQKAGPKLSVPPPLNLPSLRREHQRFDPARSGGGAAGGGVPGPRPNSAGMGWTKPAAAVAAVALQEKQGVGNHGGANVIEQSNDGRGSSVYLPPSARTGSVGPVVTAASVTYQSVQKAVLLRGEDFPSLQAATLPSASGPAQRQKDSLSQKQRQTRDELMNEQRGGTHSNMAVEMRPQLQTSGRGASNGLNESNRSEGRGFGGDRLSEQVRKQDDLPLVRLNMRSDWADDERDTGLGFTDRGKDHGFSHTEPYWDRDFDMPRISALPHKPVHDRSERQGLRDNETGKGFSSEVPKVDHYGRDARTPHGEEREGSSWRHDTLSKDVITDQVDRNGFGARPLSQSREAAWENKHIQMPFQRNARDSYGRNNAGYNHGGRQPWNNSMDSYASRGTEWNRRDRYGSEQQNRYRIDAIQSNSVSKPLYSLGGRGLPVNDPLLNFEREKRSFSKSEKPYTEDFGSTDFDGRDPFCGDLFGVVKKKKDMTRQTDFHDPVRESFEAELERVQKMQEKERQRILDEQEKALELARREEEERSRLAKEHIEKQRRLDEEAREAAWRAEEEQVLAMRRAEEQRLAREEEKRRLFEEEERRKHAAKQKLIELEERIAKRKAETAMVGGNSLAVADEDMSRMLNDKEASREVCEWENSERMVERITASVSSDSSINRSFEIGSRPNLPRDSSTFVDSRKPVNSWRRDGYDNGNNSALFLHDQGHHSPKSDRDYPVGGRPQSRKEPYGVGGLMPSRTYHKGGVAESHVDDISKLRGQRWNLPGNVDHYSRNTDIDSDFHDNFAEKFSDVGWGQGRVHENPYSPYPEPFYPNSDADGPYSFGRSRYSMRQPRVLPPPSLASMHRPPYRADPDRPSPSAFPEHETPYIHAGRSQSTVQTVYDGSRPENLRQPETAEFKQENAGNIEQNLDSTRRYDSQSSVSVSSPPSSPTPLSHDDLDDSRESSVLSASGDCKNVSLPGQENEPHVLSANPGKDSSSLSIGDDEEWPVENNQHFQQQEEYDEEEDGYEEEDGVHEDMHLVGKDSSEIDNFVLCFNEGVEVGMPNDEYDRTSMNEGTTFVVPQVVSGAVEEHGSFDGIHTGEKPLQHVDDSSQMGVTSSSRMFLETEEAMQNLVIQPNNVPHKAIAPESVDFVDSASSGSSSHHHVASSISLTPHLLPSQTEGPVKLQFGLFTGPSLIPSPVPAIQIGSIQMPLPHMHLSQPPLFQFGQLRYTSPISQGVLPLAPQPMSYIQPNITSSFSVNQNPGGPQPVQSSQGTSQTMKSDVISLPTYSSQGLGSGQFDPSQVNVSEGLNAKAAGQNTETSIMGQQGAEKSYIGDNSSRSGSLIQGEGWGHNNLVGKNYSTFSGNRGSENQSQVGASSAQSAVRGRDIGGPRPHGLVSGGGRGKKFVFTVKNPSLRSYPDSEPTVIESSGYQRRPRRNMQRTEFRVRPTAENRQTTDSASSNHVGNEEKYPVRSLRPSVRNGPRKVVMSNKHSKQMSVSESMIPGSSSSQEMEYGKRTGKGVAKDVSAKSHILPQSVEGNLKREIHSGEDVYAPLQSGVVRVFEQPGIEAPSDEDDFIEVRSKRQMLNDRREQREKEIKAKSQASKVVVPRKPHSTFKGTTGTANLGKSPIVGNSEIGNNIRPGGSAGFNTNATPQPLAPIGTPAARSDGQAVNRSSTMRSVRANSHPVATVGAKNHGRGITLDNKNNVPDNVLPPLGSWGNSQSNQQVMSLTQTQLDDAMKPGHFDPHAAIESLSTTVSSVSSSSILTNEKLFSSAANPINSLLAGEKIQFGAVTSPAILPSSSRAVQHGIGAPGPSRSEIQLSENLSAAENDCNLLFEKEKHPTESCGQLEDAEAEAAASAVAVAVIGSEVVVGNFGSCSVSGVDTKRFASSGIDGITAGGVTDQQLASQSRATQSLSVSLPADLSVDSAPISLRPPLPSQNNFLISNFVVPLHPNGVEGIHIGGISAGGSSNQQVDSQSRAEESLSVSLPADLSVETPPISLWPPVPSPQNAQMLPHFPGGPPSHFPFYEMNPMMGAPVFAYGPPDESGSTNQSQSQKNNVPPSAALGSWQQCHSGVDSFYGPPAGFTGPFISPAGGIPGVQGPPHMVVYNHFAPVGQFGQVGLSFMGTTYIPSGKQPDWKDNPVTSAMGGSEVEMNNMSMASAQRNPTNMPAPVQHMAPGSPLVPMPSPMALYDVSPFQSSADMPVQARWPLVPGAPPQSVPLSMPLHQGESMQPCNFSHGQGHVDKSLAGNRFPESRASAPFDNSRNFPVVTDATVSRFPDELGLAGPSSSGTTGASSQSVGTKSSASNTGGDGIKTQVDQNLSSSSASGHNNTSSNVKPQPSQHKNSMPNQQYGHSSYYQRGGPQRNSSGGEWPNQRSGFHGRNQSMGAEKGFPSKMKQVYVAKQTTSGNSTTS